mgnify:CR=1 FL=1
MTTQHGLDLHRSLADLAGAVDDGDLAARMTAQVGRMVGRVRRRRAARATAVGAASIGTVAAVTVGAMALGGRGGDPGPVPPATEGSSVEPTPTPEPAPTQEAAVQALAEIVAAAQRPDGPPFPECGSAVPGEEGRFVVVDLSLDPGPYEPGALLEGTARILPLDDSTVLANGPVTAAYVLLTRDGVVVGRAGYDPEHTDLLEFSADDPYPLPALGNAVLCGLDGAPAPDLPLPDGAYDAYAVVELAMKEVQHGDGTATSRSDTVWARSDPRAVEIVAP